MNERPQVILRELAPNVFVADGDLSLLGMELGHRMTVIRLASGGLWIHSPVDFSASLLGEIERLGTPKHLVAPSRTHDLYLEQWLAALPNARSFAPATLQRAHPELTFDAELGAEPLPDWDVELPHVRLGGQPRIDEHVFLHRASGSLIVADLVFHLIAKQRFFPKLLMRAAGAYGPMRTDRPFRLLIRDRAAFREGIAQLLEWDFERVITGHGEVIEPQDMSALRRHLESL